MDNKKAQITFDVELDENNIPEKLGWHASDSDDRGVSDAAFITIWDKNEKNTLRIDLWTKDMTVDDMKIYLHQVILSMSETFERATGEKAIANDVKEFGLQLGKKMGIIRENN